MAEKTWRDYVQRKRTHPSPLKGVRVLEVCTMLLGPIGPALLAQLGAEVIRCEFPPMGDVTRSLNPFGWFYKDQSPLLLHINQNKYWVGLDLHTPQGQALFCELAARCDIVENNFRPGVMESWNIGYQRIRAINPGVIFLSKTGYGQWGRYAEENRPSNDGASQALSGYSWMSRFPGQTPLKMRAYIGDNYGGMCAEVAVLAALHYRDRTGRGQFIEFSQTENIMRAMSWVWPYQDITGETAMPAGNRDLCVSPADTFRCRDDRFVAIGAALPDDFAGLCRAMGRPELARDPRFRNHLDRLRDDRTLELLDIISKWVREKTPEEVEQLAVEYGFAATRVRSVQDIVEDPHCRERGFMAYVDDPMLGPFYEYEFPVMMSKTPPKVRWSVRAIGFDNEYVLTHKLGKNKAQIQSLYDCGALGKWADMISRRPPADWDGASGVILARDAALPAGKGE